MNFQFIQYFPLLIVGIIFFTFFYYKFEKNFFVWVKDHWFLKPKWSRVFSAVAYCLGLALLLFSLLDLRGPAKKVKNDIPQQRTVVLIDSSSSMLVEDVQPNRMQKAIMLAKHFAKRAVGHAISVVLFSDFQKQIIPFTTDVDFLEARLGGLNQIALGRGSSNLTMALQESLAYLTTEHEGVKQTIGNILIFSDAEENQEIFPLDIPDTVSVAIVAVGTSKGGPIPLRQSNGLFLGNKQYQGQEITSKLGEDLLKQLSSLLKHYKYWVVQSYSVPTEDVLKFFSATHKKKFSQGQSTIRPPMLEYLVIPGLLLLMCSFLLKIFPSFSHVIIVFILFSEKLHAEDVKEASSDLLTSKIEQKLKQGNAGPRDKLKLAEIYLRQPKREEESLTIFEESIERGDWRSLDPVDLSNFAVALFKNGLMEEGFEVASTLFSKDVDPHLQEVTRQNVLLALNAQKNQNQSKNGEENKQQNKDQQKQENQQNQESQQGQSENQENQKQQSDKKEQDGQEKNKEKNQKEGETSNKPKDPNQGKEKSEEEKRKEEQAEMSQDQNQSNQEKEKKDKQEEQSSKQKKLGKKVNAQLKQLLEDDRQLQERFMDTSTTEKGKGPGIKDW